MGSNHRMSESKSDALPLGEPPINISMYKINLPRISASAQEIITSMIVDDNHDNLFHASKKFADENNPGLNSAGCYYQKNLLLSKLITKQYSTILGEKFVVHLLRFRNLNHPAPASYPPHTDVGKLFSLNYIVSVGGPNVKTVFYKKDGDYFNKTGLIATYSELEKTKEYTTELYNWYAVNVNQFHSVENIIDNRIVLSLGFNELTFNNFLDENSQLVIL